MRILSRCLIQLIKNNKAIKEVFFTQQIKQMKKIKLIIVKNFISKCTKNEDFEILAKIKNSRVDILFKMN